MLELRPGPPVSTYTTFSPEARHRQRLLDNEYRRQQYQRGVLQLVHERQLMVHAKTIPGGLSRRVIAYAASPEATEAFRREHPPQPEGVFYGSSSEDDDCKYYDPMRERAPDDGDDKQAWRQRQVARQRRLRIEAEIARSKDEYVPVYKRLVEIEHIVEYRLRNTAEVSLYFVSGLHWMCKICGHLDPAMRGKNWVDEDDPGEERMFGLGHGWCQEEAQRLDVEKRLAADLEAVKIEPELDPITDAIGQPPFVPRTGRPTAY
jgi:hypothetical protein